MFSMQYTGAIILYNIYYFSYYELVFLWVNHIINNSSNELYLMTNYLL